MLEEKKPEQSDNDNVLMSSNCDVPEWSFRNVTTQEIRPEGSVTD